MHRLHSTHKNTADRLTLVLNIATCTSKTTQMKKRSKVMQTLRAGFSKAEPNFFAPPQTPSWGREMAKI